MYNMVENVGDAIDCDDDSESDDHSSDNSESEEEDDVLSPPRFQTNEADAQLRALYLAVSWPWLLLQFSVMVLDIIIAIAQPSQDRSKSTICHNLGGAALWVGLAFLVWFVYFLDIALRIYAFGCSVFYSKCWNTFDFIVFVCSSSGILLTLFCEARYIISEVSILHLARIVRTFRMIRAGSAFMRVFNRCCACMRHVTGVHKRRFVSPEYDFDLDLAYITRDLIAMSVPSQSCLRGYFRNPLGEVVRFFELYYSENYLIINLCPEITYSPDAFVSGRVECFDVQDHAPPLMKQFVDFFEIAQKWTSAGPCNIIAVHCKGGKGRTGSICCAWLIYCKDADDADDALEIFARRRTDPRDMGRKQGVETPSQVRYVCYIEALLRQQEAFFPHQVRLPSPVEVRLLMLEAEDVFLDPVPSELVVAVHDVANRRVIHWSAVSTNSWDLGGVSVCGDVRVSVFGRKGLPANADLVESRQEERLEAEEGGKINLAGKEPGCLFYFIFHTSFLQGEMLSFPVSEVDKACQKPKLYNMEGAIKLSFTMEQGA